MVTLRRMSIVHSLMWLFDRNARREEQAKHERWLKEAPTPDPGDGPKPVPVVVGERSRRYRCRCCGHEARDTPYCVRCLAETMRPLD